MNKTLINLFSITITIILCIMTVTMYNLDIKNFRRSLIQMGHEIHTDRGIYHCYDFDRLKFIDQNYQCYKNDLKSQYEDNNACSVFYQTNPYVKRLKIKVENFLIRNQFQSHYTSKQPNSNYSLKYIPNNFYKDNRLDGIILTALSYENMNKKLRKQIFKTIKKIDDQDNPINHDEYIIALNKNGQNTKINFPRPIIQSSYPVFLFNKKVSVCFVGLCDKKIQMLSFLIPTAIYETERILFQAFYKYNYEIDTAPVEWVQALFIFNIECLLDAKRDKCDLKNDLRGAKNIYSKSIGDVYEYAIYFTGIINENDIFDIRIGYNHKFN